MDLLYVDVKEFLGILYILSGILTQLDFLLSLANVSAIHQMYRPAIGEMILMKDALHPILLKMARDDHRPKPVGNNIVSISYRI